MSVGVYNNDCENVRTYEYGNICMKYTCVTVGSTVRKSVRRQSVNYRVDVQFIHYSLLLLVYLVYVMSLAHNCSYMLCNLIRDIILIRCYFNILSRTWFRWVGSDPVSVWVVVFVSTKSSCNYKWYGYTYIH